MFQDVHGKAHVYLLSSIPKWSATRCEIRPAECRPCGPVPPVEPPATPLAKDDIALKTRIRASVQPSVDDCIHRVPVAHEPVHLGIASLEVFQAQAVEHVLAAHEQTSSLAAGLEVHRPTSTLLESGRGWQRRRWPDCRTSGCRWLP